MAGRHHNATADSPAGHHIVRRKLSRTLLFLTLTLAGVMTAGGIAAAILRPDITNSTSEVRLSSQYSNGLTDILDKAKVGNIAPGQSITITWHVKNSTGTPLILTKIEAGTPTVTTKNNSACTASALSVTGPTPGPTMLKTSGGTTLITGIAKLSQEAETGCQRAVFEVPVKFVTEAAA